MTSSESQSLLPFAFCVSCLENTRRWHQIFYILSKNLVFWFQFQVFFLNSIYSCWEICEDDITRKISDTTAYNNEYVWCAYIRLLTLLMWGNIAIRYYLTRHHATRKFYLKPIIPILFGSTVFWQPCYVNILSVCIFILLIFLIKLSQTNLFGNKTSVMNRLKDVCQLMSLEKWTISFLLLDVLWESSKHYVA